MWLIKYKRSDERVRTLEYKTERGMLKRFDELAKDPKVTRIKIFKEITYGEQLSMFALVKDELPY